MSHEGTPGFKPGAFTRFATPARTGRSLENYRGPIPGSASESGTPSGPWPR